MGQSHVAYSFFSLRDQWRVHLHVGHAELPGIYLVFTAYGWEVYTQARPAGRRQKETKVLHKDWETMMMESPE